LKIKKLHIKNFKSIADLEIIEPNPFTVFVGPNGSGKSNIFEALELSTITDRYGSDVEDFFGGIDSIKRYGTQLHDLEISWVSSENEEFLIETIGVSEDRNSNISSDTIFNHVKSIVKKKGFSFRESETTFPKTHKQFFKEFSRIFIKNIEKQKFNINSNSKLSLSCDNLEKVLKRILKDESKKEEIGEWLDLFIPGYVKVEIESNELSGTDTLFMYEKGFSKPFTKELISDGTYNILALLTAVFQSDEPQFICIEEPENGLNPRVIKELVGFFRNACEEKGHYIWLNTHSQALVSELTVDEIITVDKIKGETKIKQFKGKDFHGLSMDEAWLTNTLGGGLPW
jgi:predicted ATPase